MSALCQKRTFAPVELIVQPDAHDVVGEMRVRGDRTGSGKHKTIAGRQARSEGRPGVDGIGPSKTT